MTIPRYRDRALATYQHLTREVGFQKANIQWVQGQEAADPTSNASVHTAIMGSHYRAAEAVLEVTRNNPTTPALILEDDCRFVVTTTTTTTPETLAAAVKFLNIYDPMWQILMVGHCPLGPVCPLVEYPGLCRTSFPYSGVAYMLNPHVLATLMADIPASSWQRPFMVEGWLAVNPTHKYAFTESLTTLGDIPKEIRSIPGLGDLDLTAAAWTLSSLGMALYPLLWGLFRVFHILARLWLGCGRRRKLHATIAITTLQTGDLITVRHFQGLDSLVERTMIPTHAGVIYRDPVTCCTYIYHMCDLCHDGFSIFFRPRPDRLLLEPLEKYLQWTTQKQKTIVAVHRLEVLNDQKRQTLQKKFDALVGGAATRIYVSQPLHNIFAQFFISKPELFPFIGKPNYAVREECNTEGDTHHHYSNCFNAVMDIYEAIGVLRRRGLQQTRQIVNVEAFVTPNLSFPLRKGFSFRLVQNSL